jgi:hypothetical protein
MADIQRWAPDSAILARGTAGSRLIASDADCCCWDCPDCDCSDTDPAGGQVLQGVVTGFTDPGSCAVFNATYEIGVVTSPPDICHLAGTISGGGGPTMTIKCNDTITWTGCVSKWYVEVRRLNAPSDDCVAASCEGTELDCTTTEGNPLGMPIGTITLTTYTQDTAEATDSDCDDCGCPDACQSGQLVLTVAP